MQKENFKAPTAVQAQGWPIALSGENLVKQILFRQCQNVYKFQKHCATRCQLQWRGLGKQWDTCCLPSSTAWTRCLFGQTILFFWKLVRGMMLLVQFYLATMLSIQAYLERGDGPIVLVMAPTRFDPAYRSFLLNWSSITLSFPESWPSKSKNRLPSLPGPVS